MKAPFREGPDADSPPGLHASRLRQSFRLATWDAMLAIPFGTVLTPGNVFLTALFAKAFDLPKTTIGLIAALPFLGNLTQLAYMHLLVRRWSPQQLTVAFATAQNLTWAAFGLALPSFTRDPANPPAATFVAWFAVLSCLGSGAGVSWSSWIHEWMPAALRGKYLGRRNRFLEVTALTFVLFAGWAIASGGYSIGTFQTIIFVTVALRFGCIWCQWKSPSPAPRSRADQTLPLGSQLGALLQASAFKRFVIFGAIWSFAANAFGSFYQVFLFQQLQLDAFRIAVLVTLSQLGSAASMPVWGQLLDRYGNKTVMAVSLALWQTANITWCFIGPTNAGVLYVLFGFTGLAGAGFILGQFTLLLRVVPADAKNLAIGVNLAMNAVFAGLAPVLGGLVLSAALRASWPPLQVYHLCFAVQPMLALAAIPLLLSVQEPRSAKLTSIVGALLSIRTLVSVVGLNALGLYAFFRSPGRKRTSGTRDP